MACSHDCDKSQENSKPSCVDQLIQEIDPILVYKEVRDNKVYYSFLAGCCDFFDPIYDENCNYVCSKGGFTGAGDGLCNLLPIVTDSFLIYEK